MYKKLFLLSSIILCLILAETPSAFGQANNQEAGRPDIPGVLLFDIGFNMLNNNSLDTMDLNWWGSKVVNINYMFEFKLTDNLYFLPGVGLGLEKYRFDENVTLATPFSNPDTTMVIALNEYIDADGVEFKKSKLAINYVDIPLEFRYYTNPSDKSSSFNFGIGGKIGIMYSAHTKVNYEFDDSKSKIKEKKDFNINRFRYGVSARLGYGSFGLFGYYSLNQLFEEGNGPGGTDANVINFGITIIGF